MRVELTDPLEPVQVEPGYRMVLLIAAVGGRVIGQVWIPARRTITPALQWQAIASDLGSVAWRARVREALASCERAEEEARTPPSVSVIVCTRDRTDDLRRCLDSLAELNTPPKEVLVVDNAPSGDETKTLCAERPVRYIREPLPGQSRARNRGITEARGDVIAFTDDDCTVDQRWLDGLERELADPLTMAVTGYIGPLELETAAQLWFEQHGGFERHSERWVLDPVQTAPLRGAAVIGAGANMIFRRSAFEHAGGFAEDLGPGTPARSGDDKYAFYRVLAAGFRIVHDPARIVWHRHRRDLPGLRRIMNDYGVSEFAYTSRLLAEEGDADALTVWRWWIRHYGGDVKRYVRRSPGWVPLWITRAEAAGAVRGPLQMVRSRRSRQGIPPVTPPAPPAPAPVSGGEARLGREAPHLTVTIASHQRRDSLRRVLEMLGRQRYPADRFEVVVILDGSTDGSAEMVESLTTPYDLRAVSQPQSGLAAARNRGAHEAPEEGVLVFLDDDIDPVPDFLATHAEAHARTEGETVGLGYYPPAPMQDPSLWALRIRAWWEDHFRRKGEPGHQWSYVDFVDGNMSIRRSRLLELGCYDERFRGGRRQDWDLGLRLLGAGVRLEYLPRAVGIHRFDATIDKALANARDEGRWDVLLAQKHPQTKGHLPLARLAHAFERRPRRSSFIYHPRTRSLPTQSLGLPALRALEATGRRARWWRLSDELLNRSYAAGVLDAIPDIDRLREFLDPEKIRESTERLTLDLENCEPIDLPAAAGASEVTIRAAGRPVATITGTGPAGQWDPRELTERAVDSAAEAAQLQFSIEMLRAGRAG